MAETLSALSHIFFFAAGTAFVTAVFLWFFFGTAQVIKDLRGLPARKITEKARVKKKNTDRKGRRRPGAENTAVVTELLADENATELLTGEEAPSHFTVFHGGKT